MFKIIGNLDNGEFVKTCPNCKTIFMFNNSDIYRDEMSFSVFCPNCDKEIKFQYYDRINWKIYNSKDIC